VNDSPTPGARTIEIEVPVDAPPEEVFRILTDPAEVARWFPLDAEIDLRVGGRIWLSWGPGCEGEAPIHVLEPPVRFGWTERYGEDAEGRPVEIAVDFHVETRDGVTVLRLVQSGFTASSDWDEMYDALADGWTYFLFNLQHYVRHHRGTPRTMVWRRAETALGRDEVWRRLLASGLAAPADGAGSVLTSDAPFTAALDESYEGTIVSARPGHHLAGVLPGLEQSLLFVEIEGPHVGFWLSTYGLEPARCCALQAALDERAQAVVT
jgi:uncharacterized protein YndB with AHSA1/START domain